MKKLILFTLIFMAFLPTYAQNKKATRAEMMKEFREMKMKYIAQEIDIEDGKRSEFFELYSQMEDEKYKVFSAVKKTEKEVKSNKNATDADYERLSNQITQAKVKDAEISKIFDEKFSRILSPKQMFKMKEAEQNFRKKMDNMRRIRHKKHKSKK